MTEPSTPPQARRIMSTPPPAPRKNRFIQIIETNVQVQHTPMPSRRRLFPISDETDATVAGWIPIIPTNNFNDLNNFVFDEPAPLRIKPQIGKRTKNDNHH
jgi:hypothetical protein